MSLLVTVRATQEGAVVAAKAGVATTPRVNAAKTDTIAKRVAAAFILLPWCGLLDLITRPGCHTLASIGDYE